MEIQDHFFINDNRPAKLEKNIGWTPNEVHVILGSSITENKNMHI